MKLTIRWSIAYVLALTAFIGQAQIIASGRVFDGKNKEPLIGVVVRNCSASNGAVTDYLGNFNIMLNNLDSLLIFSYLGYKTDTLPIKLNVVNNIFLDEVNEELSPIIVMASKQSWNASNISKISLTQSDLTRHMNYLFGEADVLKTLQILPGISSGNEGTSGLYVRGGNVDQNLYLLDDAEILNPTHLGGFFSAYDIDIVKSVNIYKGGFPAKYSGRVSSIIDIKMKDGDAKKWSKKFSIGTLASKIFIEGPLKKDKTTMVLNARRSILDVLYGGLKKISGNNTNNSFGVYDLNFKLIQRLNKTNELSFQTYLGKDAYNISFDGGNERVASDTDYNVKWGNRMIAISWNYIRPTLNAKSIVSFDDYRYFINGSFKVENKIDKISTLEIVKIQSSIKNFTFKTNWSKYFNQNTTLSFGASIKNQYTNPVTNYEQFKNGKSVLKNEYNNKGQTGLIASAFTELNKKTIFDLEFIIGLNISSYIISGNKPKFYVQPRLKLNKEFKAINVFTSYSKMAQFTHLLSSNGNGFPSDSWVPSTLKAPPSTSHQISVGASPKITKNIELSAEIYYKTLDNLIVFKAGSSIINSSLNWEDKIENNGIGRIKGLEIYGKINIQKLELIVSYDLSKNTSKFTLINEGRPFPSKFDRRHEIAIAPSFKINKNISVNALWVYNTGQKLTIPSYTYKVIATNGLFDTMDSGYTIRDAEYYKSINNYQAPAYHRLDVNLSFNKKLKKGSRTFNIGIYNIYNRINPYLLFLQNKNDKVRLYKFGLFPILPSINYVRSF